MNLKETSIAFIGGGHITEILLENFIRSKVLLPEQIIVSDPIAERRELLTSMFSVSTTPDNRKAVEQSDYIFINVRPQVVPSIITEFFKFSIPEQKMLVSLAAGISIRTYRELGENRAIVRALPNPPSQVGQGIIALTFNKHVSEEQSLYMLTLFQALGEVILLEEDKINVMTALSSPVSVFYFFHSLIEAGIKMGLDKETSEKISYQTIFGSMAVWKKRNVSAIKLIKESCTPGGISEEMVKTMKKTALKESLMKTVQNGLNRADQFSENRN